jgi:hypothetical protein
MRGLPGNEPVMRIFRSNVACRPPRAHRQKTLHGENNVERTRTAARNGHCIAGPYRAGPEPFY